MLRQRIMAQKLFQNPLNQAISVINKKMDSYREGDFIEIDQPMTGDMNWWGEYGAGKICRIIRMEKGECPVSYSVTRGSGSNFFDPEIQSKLPKWIVEGISDWHCGRQADLCKVDGSHSVAFRRTLLGEGYFASVPKFIFLATYDEKNNQYIFSTQISRADNLTVKRLLEQKIAEQEKQKKEQEERLLKIQREQQAAATISKECLDSLFTQLHN